MERFLCDSDNQGNQTTIDIKNMFERFLNEQLGDEEKHDKLIIKRR